MISGNARRGIFLFPIEVLLFVFVFWADKAGWIPISKTPFLFALAWGSLLIRHASWRSVGFALPVRWVRTLLLGVAAGAAFWAFEFFVENPVLHALTGKYPDLSDFAGLVGNLQFLAIILALNLVLAAIGEELVWRGYALSRVAGLFSYSRVGWAVALALVNIAFGLAHLYQGEAGVVQACVQGVLLGILYLFSGRNLLAPMAAHFTANTFDFVTIFLGAYPGVGASH